MKTPYFLLDEKKLEENLQKFQQLCKKYFASFKISYSVKTNSMIPVLRTLNENDSDFEVASMQEINLVKNFKKFTVFNGPCKTEDEIKQAIKLNYLINADSFQEIEKISKLGGKEIGIRVCFNDGKFGIHASEIKKAIKFAESLNLKVIALSSHPGTQKTLDAYKNYIENIKKLLQDLNIKLKYLDLGGGFPDNFQLKNLNCSWEDYFKLISTLTSFETLILEPGRCLVSDSIFIIAKVHYIKENQGKKYAILDAGINLLPKIALSSFTFRKINIKKEDSEKKQEFILAGPLLFSNDLLGKFYGNLKQGDLIQINNVGAYCYNLTWEISYKKPKIITTSQKNSPR